MLAKGGYVRRPNDLRVIATPRARIEIAECLLLGELWTTLGGQSRPVFGDAHNAGLPWNALAAQPCWTAAIEPLGHHEGGVDLPGDACGLQGSPPLAFVAVLVALFALGATVLGELDLLGQLSALVAIPAERT